LLSVALLVYLACIPVNASLLQQLLEEGKYLPHFTAHWAGALVAGVLFYFATVFDKPAPGHFAATGIVVLAIVRLGGFLCEQRSASYCKQYYYTNPASWTG